MSVKKRILEVTIFLLVMFLTFYTLFSGKNLGEIANAVSKMSVGYLVPAAALAIFFVCAEGYMIWYLLQAMKANRRKEGSSLIRCIQYSFIGFFYSGITPSATGGQPVQLYYMSKDGNRGSDSTVVLMTVAVVYKFVLVILVNETKAARNKAIKSKVKTAVKKVEAAVAAKDAETAKTALRAAIVEISKAGTKGVYHKKTVSRKISRLSKAVSSIA